LSSLAGAEARGAGGAAATRGGALGRAQWLVALHTLVYSEGHAHNMRGGARATCRISSCDTAVFIGVGWIGCRRSMAGLGGS